MDDQPTWVAQNKREASREDWGKKESPGLADREDTLRKVEKETRLHLATEGNQGLEERKQGDYLYGKGLCLNLGLSIHLSPAYLKELKCKSRKLNPWVQCK